MANLLRSAPGTTENTGTLTPVISSSSKKQRFSVNLGKDFIDVNTPEEADVSGLDKVTVENNSGFTFQWRDVKTSRGKVTAVVTLPTGIDPGDVSIKLLPNNQNELCSDNLSITYTLVNCVLLLYYQHNFILFQLAN